MGPDLYGDRLLEAIRKRLVAIPVPRAVLQASDYAAAVPACVVVVLATLPVAIPFLLIRDPRIAMAVSRGLTLLTLSLPGACSGATAEGPRGCPASP